MSYYPYKTYEATFGIGTRVRVIRQRKYPSENLKGLIGTVRTDSGTNVSVIFDTIKNPRSSYGCFYFKASELVAVDEFDNDIVEEKTMSKIINYLNVAKVKTLNDHSDNPTLYKYANFEPDLKVGDRCVVTGLTTVWDRFAAPRGLSVVDVVDIECRNDIEVDGEIVDIVDERAYNDRVKCRIKAAELKAKMEARAKQLQDIALYQMLAKDDPDMAVLLNEYQSLPKM